MTKVQSFSGPIALPCLPAKAGGSLGKTKNRTFYWLLPIFTPNGLKCVAYGLNLATLAGRLVMSNLEIKMNVAYELPLYTVRRPIEVPASLPSPHMDEAVLPRDAWTALPVASQVQAALQLAPPPGIARMGEGFARLVLPPALRHEDFLSDMKNFANVGGLAAVVCIGCGVLGVSLQLAAGGDFKVNTDAPIFPIVMMALIGCGLVGAVGAQTTSNNGTKAFAFFSSSVPTASLGLACGLIGKMPVRNVQGGDFGVFGDVILPIVAVALIGGVMAGTGPALLSHVRVSAAQ